MARVVMIVTLVVVLTLGLAGATLIPSNTDASSTREERCNRVIDGHVEAGGRHGEAAGELRSSLCG